MKNLITLLLLSTLVAACGDDIKGESGQDATALALYAFNRANYQSNPDDATEVIVVASEANPVFFAIGDPRDAGDDSKFTILETTATLTVDLDEEGPGGLDALPKEADTIYYLYAINDNGAPKLLGSKNPPTDGPTNIEAGKWTYLGGFATNSASDVVGFRSVNGFYKAVGTVDSVNHNGDTNYTEREINIAETAGIVLGTLKTDGPVDGQEVHISGTPDGSSGTVSIIVASIGNFSEVVVPLESPRKVYLHTSHASNPVYFFASGWIEDPTLWP